ncbi:Protein of unknown function [Gryllus bimaculatus]|nr:Protein of unknown function [Gryllus bimaculatus]
MTEEVACPPQLRHSWGAGVGAAGGALWAGRWGADVGASFQQPSPPSAFVTEGARAQRAVHPDTANGGGCSSCLQKTCSSVRSGGCGCCWEAAGSLRLTEEAFHKKGFRLVFRGVSHRAADGVACVAWRGAARRGALRRPSRPLGWARRWRRGWQPIQRGVDLACPGNRESLTACATQRRSEAAHGFSVQSN